MVLTCRETKGLVLLASRGPTSEHANIFVFFFRKFELGDIFGCTDTRSPDDEVANKRP